MKITAAAEQAALTSILQDLGVPVNPGLVNELRSHLRVGEVKHLPEHLPLGTLQSSIASHIAALKEEANYRLKKALSAPENASTKRPRAYQPLNLPPAYQMLVQKEDPEMSTSEQLWVNYDSTLLALVLAARFYLALCQDHSQPGDVITVTDGYEDAHVVRLPPGTTSKDVADLMRNIRKYTSKHEGEWPMDGLILAELAIRGFTSRKPVDGLNMYPFL